MELMVEHGYAGTTMSMITERSGMPASSTYWHFGSKESLLLSVVEYSANSWLAALPRWESLSGSPVERLSELVEHATVSLNDQVFRRVIMLLALENSGSQEVMNTVRRVRQSAAGGFRKAFSEIFTGADDPNVRSFADELGVFCLAATDGIFLALDFDDNVDVRKQFAFLRTAFMSLGTEFMSRRNTSIFVVESNRHT